MSNIKNSAMFCPNPRYEDPFERYYITCALNKIVNLNKMPPPRAHTPKAHSKIQRKKVKVKPPFQISRWYSDSDLDLILNLCRYTETYI